MITTQYSLLSLDRSLSFLIIFQILLPRFLATWISLFLDQVIIVIIQEFGLTLLNTILKLFFHLEPHGYYSMFPIAIRQAPIFFNNILDTFIQVLDHLGTIIPELGHHYSHNRLQNNQNSCHLQKTSFCSLRFLLKIGLT